MIEPPPVIGSSRLLEYAAIDSSIVYTGYIVLYVDGILLGPVPRIAVCQDLYDQGIVLFLCNENWEVRGVCSEDTLSDAKKTADRCYRGLSEKWLVSPYSDEEVTRYWDQRSKAGERCSFCQRRFWEFQKLYTVPDTEIGICDICIKSLYQDLTTDPECPNDSPIL